MYVKTASLVAYTQSFEFSAQDSHPGRLVFEQCPLEDVPDEHTRVEDVLLRVRDEEHAKDEEITEEEIQHEDLRGLSEDNVVIVKLELTEVVQ